MAASIMTISFDDDIDDIDAKYGRVASDLSSLPRLLGSNLSNRTTTPVKSLFCAKSFESDVDSKRTADEPVDSDDANTVLLKFHMLAMAKELLAGFSSKAFQEKQCALDFEVLPDVKAFTDKWERLKATVQYEVLPKYGFGANPEGVESAQQGCAQFRGDWEMDRVLDSIDIMLGKKNAETLHLSREEAMKVYIELLRGFSCETFQKKLSDFQASDPHGIKANKAHMALALSVQGEVLMKHGLPGNPGGVKQLETALSVFHGDSEIEKARTQVGALLGKVPARPHLSKQQATELLRELLLGFSNEDFLLRWQKVSLAQPRPTKERVELALSVQRKVLPKFGFPGTHSGVTDMVKTLAKFRGDHDVDAISTAIDAKLGIQRSAR
jgi:hypothetical protein